MGQRINLVGANFVRSILKRTYDDAGLNDGSLCLLDTTHSLSRLATPPVNGQLIPNVAIGTASRLIGAGDATSLAFAFSSTMPTTELKMELTGKGAIHSMLTQLDQGLHHCEPYASIRGVRVESLHAWLDHRVIEFALLDGGKQNISPSELPAVRWRVRHKRLRHGYAPVIDPCSECRSMDRRDAYDRRKYGYRNRDRRHRWGLLLDHPQSMGKLHHLSMAPGRPDGSGIDICPSRRGRLGFVHLVVCRRRPPCWRHVHV
jgi:hypothetical protein